MKLTEFKIQNYRSIVNTGWVTMAPDNITTLIGQNESGKTSLLEGLNSFYNGRITEDILRSDMSLPKVSCLFKLEKATVQRILQSSKIPEIFLNNIKNSTSFVLTRKWVNKNESLIIFGDDELHEEIENKRLDNRVLEDDLSIKASNILAETSELIEKVNDEERSLKELRKSLDILEAGIAKSERIQNRSSNTKKLEAAKANEEEFKKEASDVKLKLEKINVTYTNHNSKLTTLIKKSEYADRFNLSKDRFLNKKNALLELKERRNTLLERIHFTADEKQKQSYISELKGLNNQIDNIRAERDDALSNYQFARECFNIASNGQNGKDIESIAWEKVEKEITDTMLEETGNELFELLPEFTLFEDFSSLLPNRIDMEDILIENEKIEGFNAARNFLIVSGLDANFFRESNNRILKQKIENLNGEITLNFQGYWRQNLGKNNKIKLNFELEHYDFNHPDKKGQPYLEFWIKDEHERLYPKQRSRGVRWFLSFYLELKATALANEKKGKILLIDEPGLSLHARAQEDVLKVFEDLKENIQIIYSTHSPHLVNTDKIYRLLAVQRADEYDDRSETRVFNARELANASGDTLSPIYTLLGTQISESNFIRERNNIIVEDTCAFYYISSLFSVFFPEKEVYFLPSADISSIPALINLLTGWKLKFGVLLSDTREAANAIQHLQNHLFSGKEEELSGKVKILSDITGFENLFSTIDFKKYVLQKRIGITESNLEYIDNNGLSRVDLASAFALYCQNNKIKPNDFDEESRGNINNMFNIILNFLK